MAYSSSASSSLMTTLSSSVIDHKDKCVHVQDRLGRSTSLTAPIPEEVDVYLSQLKSKRAVQDEDMSTGGKCAEVLSSPEVSHVIRILFGEEKKELKPETREVLKNLENFAKEFIKATNTTNGSKAMEALMEVAHTHDNLIFRQVVGNEPVDWATAGFPVFEGNARKELLKERVIKDVDTKRAARRELAKNTGLVKKELEELKVVRVKREEKIKPDNLRRLHIALDSYKGQADKLKAARDKRGNFASTQEMQDLLEKFEKLQEHNQTVKNELNQLTANGALPPDIQKASRILAERKAYLDALQEQISNPYNLSRRSLNNSVFNSSA